MGRDSVKRLIGVIGLMSTRIMAVYLLVSITALSTCVCRDSVKRLIGVIGLMSTRIMAVYLLVSITALSTRVPCVVLTVSY